MSPIVFAVIAVAVIGLVCAIMLCVASILFAVPVDEKAEKIRECLPGANCGACGFSGCDGYAAALSQGKTENTALCIPGGNDVSQQIAEITGKAAGNITPMTAVVLCCGNNVNTELKLEYQGVKTCKMAQQLFGGPKSCTYGCIGFGDCVRACPYDAIFICEGIARVNPGLCRACKTCVAACPKSLIEMLPLDASPAAVVCKNKDKGGQTKKQCKVGCIGCMRCVKACEFGAVTVKDNVAHVDYDKCTGCGKCTAVCPSKCITIVKKQNHIFDVEIETASSEKPDQNEAATPSTLKKDETGKTADFVSFAEKTSKQTEAVSVPASEVSSAPAPATKKENTSSPVTAVSSSSASSEREKQPSAEITKPAEQPSNSSTENKTTPENNSPTADKSTDSKESVKISGSAVADTKAALKKQK